MRLLDVKTFKLHEFFDDSETRPYAILSHTWGAEECTFQQMTEPGVELGIGYKKIRHCCEQAAEDGLQWAWIDTCCIDKTNLVELSEAINSMFRWYQQAHVCYVYLEDVETVSQMGTSRWFTRGWTLQELLAPHEVRFYSANWQYLGNKLKLRGIISDITGIGSEVLLTGQLDQTTVAQKMRWAANRKTTRTEDAAYCLLGIFGVNMPLQYGEGSTKAFIRLQEGIMKVSDDYTLFAWNLPAHIDSETQDRECEEYGNSSEPKDISIPELSSSQKTGLLAESPAQFLSQFQLRATPSLRLKPASVIGDGVQIELPVVFFNGHNFAILPCAIESHLDSYVGFLLHQWDELWQARVGHLVLVSNSFMTSTQASTLYIKKPFPTTRMSHSPQFRLQLSSNIEAVSLDLEELYCLPHATKIDHRTVELRDFRDGPLCAYILRLQSTGKAFGHKQHLPDVDLAVIVGTSADITHSWLAVVPLLHADRADKDFYAWLRLDAQLVRCCMTRSELRERLGAEDDTKMPFLAQATSSFHKSLLNWVDFWQELDQPKFSPYVFSAMQQKKSLVLTGTSSLVKRNLFETATLIKFGVEFKAQDKEYLN